MSVAPGQRLGPYEIVAKLGEGGMGEVWRAKDAHLGREVALKVLPEAVQADPERLARFEREAKVLAQLNHPNIAQIYGLETSGGERALVMELVEGPTLADRLESGVFSLAESFSLSLQIALALEEAHEKGIVHRDLKPQNIKASHDGKVKVLDFGLAKALDPVGSASGGGGAGPGTLANSPTLTAVHGTQLGMILGTAAYMAPEQAKGLAVDKRADIWAFGVVLYEMLAGSRLFSGDTVTDTLADVLRREIDLDALPPETPPAIRDLVRRCLERNPRNRLHDIADARLVIEEVLAGRGAGGAPAQSTGAPAVGRRRRAREAAAWTLAALALLAALVGFGRGAAGPGAAGVPSPAAPLRFSVAPQVKGTLEGYPAMAWDGRRLAYVVVEENGPQTVWIHDLETGSARRVAGSENAEQPFWSPDGRWLGFFGSGQLRRLDLATGLVQNLHPVVDARGGSWAADGRILLSANAAAPILEVDPAGGVRSVSELAPGVQSHRFPWALPGGSFLFTLTGSLDRRGIYWQEGPGRPPRRILPDVSRAIYDERGSLFWIRGGTLVAQRFDPAGGALAGPIVPVAEGIAVDSQKYGSGQFAVSPGGTLAFRHGLQRDTELVWFDRAGKPLGALTPPAPFREPTLSPDGSRVAAGLELADNNSIWIYDADGFDRGRRLTFDPAGTETPIWSPDGRWVAYTAARAEGHALVRKAADGSGEEEVLLAPGVPSWIDAWTPDGKSLVIERFEPGKSVDLWLLPLEGDRRPVPLLDSPANEAHSSLSPDGKLLAYVADDGALPQVFVQTMPPSGSRWQVSRNGGDWPAWRADGKEIYFVGFDRTLHAIPVTSLSPFAFGHPQALFRLRTPQPAMTSNRTFFTVSGDGRRFLVNQLVAGEQSDRLELVANWRLPAPAK